MMEILTNLSKIPLTETGFIIEQRDPTWLHTRLLWSVLYHNGPPARQAPIIKY